MRRDEYKTVASTVSVVGLYAIGMSRLWRTRASFDDDALVLS